MRRNLFYNLCALDWNDEWKLNLERLGRYEATFNGRRIVVVRTGPGIVAADKIKASFPFEAEFIERPNDPKLHETSGFIETLELLASEDPGEATFYAHTKGVKHGKTSGTSGMQQLASVRQWRNRMYDECLRDPELVDRVMAEKNAAGCFIWQTIDHPPVAWHFAGTFYWLSHRLFSKPDWRKLPNPIDMWSVELYPGVHFPREEAHSFYENPEFRLYFSAAARVRCARCRYEFDFDANALRRHACVKCRCRWFKRLGYADLDILVPPRHAKRAPPMRVPPVVATP